MSFLYEVWEDLSAQNKTSHYFLNDDERQHLKDPGLLKLKEMWWARVSPLLEGRIPWPGANNGSIPTWKRLATDVKTVMEAYNSWKSGVRVRLSNNVEGQTPGPSTRGKRKASTTTRNKKKQRRKTSTAGEMCTVEHDTVIEGSANVIPTPAPDTEEPMDDLGEDSGAHDRSQPSGDRPNAEFAPEREPLHFDLTTFTASERTSPPIVWKGNDGSRVTIDSPLCKYKDPEQRNVLWKAAEVMKELATTGITQIMTPDLLVIEKEWYDEKTIVDIVTPYIASNKPVLAKGARIQKSWEDGITDDTLRNLKVARNRECEVFDIVERERNALRGGDDTNDEDLKYERAINPTLGEKRWYLPTSNNRSERLNMTVDSFILGISKGKVLCILDFPTTSKKGIPFCALDHIDEAMNNTKWLGEHATWRDLTWGLIHAGQVITWWHHDADGKVTVVNAETGAKIWTLFIPNAWLSSQEVQEVNRWMAERKERLPKENLGKIVNVLLLPGDTLFMPPGMLHMVYTPVPSIFRGSSFWNINTLHLTALSLKEDSLAGEALTNVDHDYKLVFDAILRLVLSVPFMDNFEIRKSFTYLMYDLLINAQDYMSVYRSESDYPGEDEEALSALKNHRGSELKKTRNCKLALVMLEQAIKADGRRIPEEETRKSSCSKRWIQELETSYCWSDPGPIIRVGREQLTKYMPLPSLAKETGMESESDLTEVSSTLSLEY
ncbi:hypothetical protein V5O48_015308 [Marasmius crinis-equi]|uniref:JmjC domain-containing protein n=1 Tax=Marasmius crinis-equi TaxID=585013 RepID=A0ABR3EUW6_9AGAR